MGGTGIGDPLAPGPSPRPVAPWQEAQFWVYSILPRARSSGAVGRSSAPATPSELTSLVCSALISAVAGVHRLPGHAVQQGLSQAGLITAEAFCDTFGIPEKACCLLVFKLGDELARPVDRLAVLFDGDADDAGEPFCGVILCVSGHGKGRQKGDGQ